MHVATDMAPNTAPSLPPTLELHPRVGMEKWVEWMERNANLQISKEILRNQCEKSDPADLARLEEQVAKLEEGSQRAAVTL